MPITHSSEAYQYKSGYVFLILDAHSREQHAQLITTSVMMRLAFQQMNYKNLFTLYLICQHFSMDFSFISFIFAYDLHCISEDVAAANLKSLYFVGLSVVAF